MDIINLGNSSPSESPQKPDPNQSGGSTGNTPNTQNKDLTIKNSDNPASISINFTPTIPTAETKPTIAPKQKIMKLDISKAELNRILPPEPALNISKPSTAWGNALDVNKAVAPKAVAKVESIPKIDFFNSSSLQEKSGTSKLMENITSQKLKIDQPKIGDILGKQSKILEKTIEQETLLNYKKRLRVVQFMTFIAFITALGINVFFYSQLSPGVNVGGFFNYNFESNLRNDLFNLNENLSSLQTELNTYRFLSGQLYLNQFGYETTRFMDAVNNKSGPTNSTNNTDIDNIINDSKDSMPKLLQGAKDNITKPLVIELFPTRGEAKMDEAATLTTFQNKLKASILAVKKSVLDAHTDTGLDPVSNEGVFYDNSFRMVGNAKLTTNLQSSNIDNFKNQVDLYSSTDFDPTQRNVFKKSINNLLDTTKVNLATITNLRNERVKWSDVLNRIEAITDYVNSQHNKGGKQNNDSVITYSAIDFNAENGTVSVSGLNTTKQGTNREVVTYLMEAFELSPEFKNATNRSFPLNKVTDTSGKSVYSMNFKIDMEIEKGSFSKLNSPIASLNESSNKLAPKIQTKSLTK